MPGREADAGKHLLTVAGHGAGAAAGDGLGERRVHGRLDFPRRVQRRAGGFDGHHALGQAMADGLEGGDRAPELNAFHGVLAGQLEHRPRRPDQLVRQGHLSGGHRRRPVRRLRFGG